MPTELSVNSRGWGAWVSGSIVVPCWPMEDQKEKQTRQSLERLPTMGRDAQARSGQRTARNLQFHGNNGKTVIPEGRMNREIKK